MQLSRSDRRLLLVTRLAIASTFGLVLSVAGCERSKGTVDPPLVTIGRAYSATITGSYAAAWVQAAAEVEAGGPIAPALAKVRPASDAARTKAFEASVSPAFAAIVPEGTPDDQVDASRRAALAKAFREFARGVSP